MQALQGRDQFVMHLLDRCNVHGGGEGVIRGLTHIHMVVRVHRVLGAKLAAEQDAQRMEFVLQKERLEHSNAFYARDSLRAEQNKHISAEKEKKAVVAQLAAETDNLNSLINGIEKEMLKLKKRYEQAVEERNYTGIQLIDRNDELCILYEKSNDQEQAGSKE